MPYVREFTGLNQEQSTALSSLFTKDGANCTVVAEEGSYKLVVEYQEEAWKPSFKSVGQVLPPAKEDVPLWAQLIETYKADSVVPPQLKTASLSQWIIESGRGTSELSRRYCNFGGIKFRERMKGFAEPVDYEASDGAGVYCKFASPAAFIQGYWHFIESGPYDGFDAFKDDGPGYLRHIAPKYASDAAYLKKVLGVFSEADQLLGPADIPPAKTEAPGVLKLAVVVGHNSKAPGAFGSLPIGKYEFAFNNLVADQMMLEAPHYNLNVKKFNRQPSSSYSSEIATVYEEVRKWGANAAIELHFNSASADATGTEVLFASSSSKSRNLALSLVEAIRGALGLPIRRGNGLFPCSPGERGYASLVALDEPTALVEPFFGSNSRDCTAVAAIGPEGLSRAYLRGVRDWAMQANI